MANEKQDEVDRVLDAALAKYAAAEPMAGLEQRVLATLRAERAQIPDRAWWRWSIAGALAAAVILALTLALRSGRTPHPVVANHPASTTPSTALGPSLSPTQIVSNPRSARSLKSRRSYPLVATAGHGEMDSPRLDQFPSPQPLNEQERALARYVSDFPQEATLVARAQDEYEKEIQQKMKDAHSETEFSNSDESNSDEQER